MNYPPPKGDGFSAPTKYKKSSLKTAVYVYYMVVLGLDASTSTVGWAFNKDGIIIDAGFIDIKKYVSNKEKSFAVIKKLESLQCTKEIDIINLEAALSGFAGGFTRQQTVITLIRFNAIFDYILSEHFKLPINLLSVNTLRKNVFGKCRISGIKSKEFVKMQLEEKYPDVKNFLILNTKGKLDIRNCDMYDAMICALYQPTKK